MLFYLFLYTLSFSTKVNTNPVHKSDSNYCVENTQHQKIKGYFNSDDLEDYIVLDKNESDIATLTIFLKKGTTTGTGRGNLYPRTAGDEGVPEPAGGDKRDDRCRRLAAHRRHRLCRRGRLLLHRRPSEGAHQVQGDADRSRGAGSGAALASVGG